MEDVRRECSLCGTEEDPDEFVVIGTTTLCRNCRTCPHGNVHYEQGAWDVCYFCVRQRFTYEWFWGPAIADMAEYLAYAEAQGLMPGMLQGWTWAEEELLMKHTEERGWQPKETPTLLPAFLPTPA